MAELVFVHGVATRAGVAYDKEVAQRDELFRTQVFGGNANISSPYWGGFGASFAFEEKSLPRFGSLPVSFNLLGNAPVAPAASAGAGGIAALAAQDFQAAVDTLYAVLIEGNAPLAADQLREFGAIAAYVEANDKPAWVDPAMTDKNFVERLRMEAEVKKPASYGLVDKLKTAAGAVVDRSRNLISKGLVPLVRDDLNPLVAAFLGDVFVYLVDGPRRSSIRSEVAKALSTAHQRAKAGSGPLVVVGHSMGGVILYDMLTDPTGAGLPADLRIDALVTVGSQPGFFEELKLFKASDPAIPGAGATLAASPASVGHWWNVFDPIDVLGFRAEQIFAGVEDFVFDSVTGVINAHTTYFKRPLFYGRLRARLAGI
jgi:hypothetical protein